MPTTPENALAVLGIKPDQERLYRAVLSMSGKSAKEVAETVDHPVQRLAEDLAPFVELGIVTFDDGVVNARLPTDAIVRRAQQEIEVIKEAADRLYVVGGAIPAIRVAFPPGPTTTDTPLDGEVRVGGDIPALFVQLIKASTGTICWLRPDQWAMSHESALTRELAAALESGRQARAIYPLRALDEAPEALQSRAAAGEEIRLLPEVPTRLAIFGASGALLQESFGLASNRRLLVRERGVLEVIQALFDQYWNRAVRVPGLLNPEAERRRVLQTLLLRQLAEGAKDERIARSLGLSLRTVRRRVSELLDELHAETRFQAGVEALRRGWL